MKNSRRRRRLKSRSKTPSKRTSVNQQQLSFDQLEARHLLAALVVNSAADLPVDLSDGVVTLRVMHHPLIIRRMMATKRFDSHY